MIRYFFLFLLFTSVSFANDLSQEHNDPPSKPYKYTLSVCATFGNEANYLKEWIEFHQLAGVDHFYLYNIESTDDVHETLVPYIQKEIVTVVNWPNYMGDMAKEIPFLWTLGLQVPAYEHAIVTKAREETRWLVFLDVDEFLVPIKNTNVKEILKNYESMPGISLATQHFQGSSLDFTPRQKFMLEMTDLTAPPQEHIQNTISKVIFKPEYYKGFSYPPFECLFMDKVKPVAIANNVIRVNRYVNRFKGNILFAREKEKIDVEHRVLSDEKIESLLKSGYEIEDRERAIQRFLPSLLQRMDCEPHSR